MNSSSEKIFGTDINQQTSLDTDIRASNDSSAPPSVGGTAGTVYIQYVSLPLLLVLGIIGNCLTIRVMTSQAFRNLPVSKLLVCLSLSDVMVNCLEPFNRAFVRQMLGTDVRALSQAGCRLYFWAYRFSRLTSSWIVVMISVERFVAVWLHVRARRINTTANAYLTVAVICGLFAVYVGYLCSWADRVVDGTCIINSRTPSLERRSRAFLAVSLVLYDVVPSSVLIVVNSLILYKLIALRRKKSRIVAVATSTAGSAGPRASQQEANQQSRGRRTTVMLMSVTFSFVVLITPNAVAHLVSFIKKKDIFETSDGVTIVLREVSQVSEQLNHSINFLLYVFSSKRFRDGIVVLCRKRASFTRALS